MVSFGYTVFLHFDNRRQRTCFFHLRRRICRRVALLSVSRSVAAAAWAAASAVSRRQPTSRRLMRACPVALLLPLLLLCQLFMHRTDVGCHTLHTLKFLLQRLLRSTSRSLVFENFPHLIKLTKRTPFIKSGKNPSRGKCRKCILLRFLFI